MTVRCDLSQTSWDVEVGANVHPVIGPSIRIMVVTTIRDMSFSWILGGFGPKVSKSGSWSLPAGTGPVKLRNCLFAAMVLPVIPTAFTAEGVQQTCAKPQIDLFNPSPLLTCEPQGIAVFQPEEICPKPSGSQSPAETPKETPTESRIETPLETPRETPRESQFETPLETPIASPTPSHLFLGSDRLVTLQGGVSSIVPSAVQSRSSGISASGPEGRSAIALPSRDVLKRSIQLPSAVILRSEPEVGTGGGIASAAPVIGSLEGVGTVFNPTLVAVTRDAMATVVIRSLGGLVASATPFVATPGRAGTDVIKNSRVNTATGDLKPATPTETPSPRRELAPSDA